MLLNALVYVLLVCVVNAQNTSYGSLPKGNYNELTLSESSSLSHLFVMAESFVNIVFPTIERISGYVTKVLTDPNVISSLQNDWQTLLSLEAGFFVCVVFGLLFIIFVPIIGVLMCFCRTCCQNCGGKMTQTTRRSISCWRNCFCLTLFLLCVFMTIPTVFVFLTNGWITSILVTAPNNTQVAIGNGIEYIHSLDRQLQYVVQQYGNFDGELRDKILNFGANAGSDAADLAFEQAKPALDAFDDVINTVNALKTNLTNVNASTSTLLDGINMLKDTLNNQTSKMQVGLASCTNVIFDPFCHAVLNSTYSIKVQVDTQIFRNVYEKASALATNVPIVGHAVARGEDVISSLLSAPASIASSQVNVASTNKISVPIPVSQPGSTFHTPINDFLNKTTDVLNKLDNLGLAERRNSTTKILDGVAEKVQNETGKLISATTAELDNANATFQSLLQKLPTDMLTNSTMQLKAISDSIPSYFDVYTKNFDKYRYIAGLALAAVLLSIVIFYYLGICLGVCGHRKEIKPDQRTALSNYGGLALMSGAGLSFIFSWLFMILVLVTFTIGGHLERYVCQTLSKPYTGIQIIEENVNTLNISSILGVDADLTIVNILNGCEQDMSLYNVLKLESLFNIDTIVNDIKSKLDFSQVLDNTTFDLDFNLYSDEVKDLLDKVNVSEINKLDVGDLQQQAANATSPSLLDYATFLNNSADNFTASASLEASLARMYSNEIIKIQQQNVDPLIVRVNELADQVNILKQGSGDIVTAVENLRTKLQEVDEIIQKNATSLVKEAILPSVQDITNHVIIFIDWTVMQLKDNFGACKPVMKMYDQIILILCKYIVDTINGLWFSLGWCVFLLIPSAIIAMKLAKFYRRMFYAEDESEEESSYKHMDAAFNDVESIPMKES